MPSLLKNRPVKPFLTVLALSAHFSISAQAQNTWPLTKASKPACTVVVVTAKEPDLLMEKAQESITSTVQRWSDVDLPVAEVKGAGRILPVGSAIVLTTLDRLKTVAPEVETLSDAVRRIAFTGEQGFACVPVENRGVWRMYVVSRTPRGVFNGAIYLRDFLIDGTKDNLYLQHEPVVRSPQMEGRPVYLLTIWGNEDEYTVQNWMTVFDSFARDGMDRVYFWLSGHFPSQRFPQTYKVADKLKGLTYDSTKDSGIPTLEDQRLLIRYAHDMGLKFYLGGALGGWVGTLFLTNLEPDTFKKHSTGDAGVDQSEESLCPSNSNVRQALIQYYKEMFDALPEADGLYLESADEMGGCQCRVCNKPIDAYGSRQFGRAQLSLIQEIMHEIWRDHPQARLAYTVGYNPHGKDPAYYEAIRQMRDPRLEWMEARGSWEFPGPKGEPLPAPYFSRYLMGWRYHDDKPLEKLVSDINRMGKEGWYGCISTFSPGFSSGSFYKNVPLPTDQLPYVLTHFAHREATWEPALSTETMRIRVQRRFFGKEASERLGKDLWNLRELIRAASSGVWGLNPSGAWDYIGCKEVSTEALAEMDQIKQHIAQAQAGASPKTLEGLNLMTRAVDDIRKYCSKKP